MEQIVDWGWLLLELAAWLVIMGTIAYLVWEGTVGYKPGEWTPFVEEVEDNKKETI